MLEWQQQQFSPWLQISCRLCSWSRYAEMGRYNLTAVLEAEIMVFFWLISMGIRAFGSSCCYRFQVVTALLLLFFLFCVGVD